MSGLKGNHQNEQTFDRHSTLEVSRHTIRQALRELKTDGLILWRTGIGTIVRTQPEKIWIMSGLNTLTDLLEFATETEMQILSKTPQRQGQRECWLPPCWKNAVDRGERGVFACARSNSCCRLNRSTCFCITAFIDCGHDQNWSCQKIGQVEYIEIAQWFRIAIVCFHDPQANFRRLITFLFMRIY